MAFWMIEKALYFTGMLKPILLLAFCCATTALFAQSDTSNKLTVVNTTGDSATFEKVEVEAEFPGGFEGWKNYLMANVNTDKITASVPKSIKHWQQQAIVQFIVCTDGSICDIRVVNKVSPEVEKEAKRLIATSPNWAPAVQNGRKVKAYRKQPITFAVDAQ